ncbi:pyridoxal kinase [Vibrio algicola]|uniref:pyridoxal kinase n=1 Tax=Vibrio algicola TaxID=2662262 RepID=A0A5Q0TPC3_9VIBR|nr:pyridoxal kinase [Vibrio algicola]
MKGIISIQPHVVYGHDGNSSAVFPIQRMGIDIWPIHTGQYSNHTQYQQGWTGRSYPADDINAAIQGLDNIHQLSNCQAVISGYLSNTEQCTAVNQAITQVKNRNHSALYVCDPAIENHVEASVHFEQIQTQIIQQLVPISDVVVSNQYELEQLTGLKINNIEDAIYACQRALTMGPNIILIKHLPIVAEKTCTMMLATPKVIYISQRPWIEFTRSPVGVGALVTALFTACLVNQMSPVAALQHTNNALYGVLELTRDNNSCELETVSAQYEFVEPTFNFPLQKINFKKTISTT